MACEKYTNCKYCRKDFHCPYDHMGDGTERRIHTYEV